MSFIFNSNKNSSANPSTLYTMARTVLLITAIFTAVYLVILILNVSFIYLFSANIPLYAVSYGRELARSSGNPVFYYAALGLAVLVIGLYLLSWFLSAKKRSWMIFAAVLFGLDCLVMVVVPLIINYGQGFIGFTFNIDFIVHACIMYALIRGISTRSKEEQLAKRVL